MFKRLYYWFYRLTSHPQERGEYSSGYWQYRIRREVLNLCNGTKGKILEIGCGGGLFLIPLARENPDLEVWGIDSKKAGFEIIEKKAKTEGLKNINLSLQDAYNLSFKGASFDTVVCINFLLNMESIKDVKKILAQMKRICKNSGVLVFEFRNSLNMFFVLKYKLAKYYDATIRRQYLNTYNPRQIETVLKDLGLVITNKRVIGFPLKLFAPIIIIEAKKDAG